MSALVVAFRELNTCSTMSRLEGGGGGGISSVHMEQEWPDLGRLALRRTPRPCQEVTEMRSIHYASSC